MSARRSAGLVAAVLAAGLLLRAAYLASQPAVDPTFDRPILDGRYYADWASALVAGTGPAGAFYLAPLYPYALSALWRLRGPDFGTLYALQHLLMLAAAGLLAAVARRRAGTGAACAVAGLYVLHHPLLFFASMPLGEPLALSLLALALYSAERETRAGAATAGLALGLAALARPNLLVVPVLWAAAELRAGRKLAAALLVAGVALPLVPAAVHNGLASGHLVLISSNGGMTAYHGNGPGAGGTFTQPAGFSGSLAGQREEATAIARERSGLPLDAVEADRWWGRQAWRERWRDPLGTARLVATRARLLADSREHGLDQHPRLDDDPWRPTFGFGRPNPVSRGKLPELEIPWVPFGLLLGLALAALVTAGEGGAGGRRV
ncbi:MAG TPA: hypothetical protein VJS92_10165, partial [Candidatus Polarisedimenticolaceae bacterium]|nr:hypothetical protein [Candidatus Polarisedimenticolaceae bacterium]